MSAGTERCSIVCRFDVDRGGAEAAHDLEHHGDRDRGRETGEDLADADDDAAADEARNRRDVHAAVREHREPEHEPGGDRGVEHADADSRRRRAHERGTAARRRPPR